MARYLIVTDIDGTLIPKSQKVSSLTQAVFKKLHDQGHETYIASGRLLALARTIANQVDPKMGIICSNGAVIARGDDVQTHMLGTDAALAAYQICDNLDLALRLFTLTDTYHTSRDEQTLAHMRFLRRGAKTKMIELTSRQDVMAIGEQITNGLAAYRNDLNRLNQARREFAETNLFSLSASNPNNIELIPKGVSKATALRQVQTTTGIDVEHTVVFGNGLNDVPMFSEAAVSVAMADSPQAVIDAASTTTEPVNEEGVPRFLMKMFKLTEPTIIAR